MPNGIGSLKRKLDGGSHSRRIRRNQQRRAWQRMRQPEASSGSGWWDKWKRRDGALQVALATMLAWHARQMYRLRRGGARR